MRRGRFITLEGGEGAGKSTQAALLAGWLGGRGIAVVASREPGGPAGSEAIRRFVKGTAEIAWAPKTEALLHYAARQEHLERLIRPSLAAGRWVVSDRFADSTRAYQGAGQGIDAAWLDRLEALVVGGDRPDLTLILDLDRDRAAHRLAGRDAAAPAAPADRYEREDAAFHQRVRDAFRAIAAADPGRCRLIDGGRPVEAVAAAIRAAVAARFPAELGAG